MATQFEGRFQGCKETELVYRLIKPNSSSTTPKLNVILTHGQAEHSGSYSRVFTALQGLPIQIFAWDLRGHGRSQGQRGYVENFEDYCLDLDLMIAEVKRQSPLPILLFGHSMGGLITLKTSLQTTRGPFKKLILSSPMMGLSIPVPKFKETLAKVSAQFFPKLTLWNEILFEQLSRDPEVLAEYPKDHYRHDRICSAAFLGSKEAMKFVFDRAHQIAGPSVFMISDADPIVSTPEVQRLFELIPGNKKLKLYPKRTHEIFNDIDREQPLGDLVQEIKEALDL